ncbi:hypothetical protein F5Y06DRAFT_137588 [Hypoxylon sp. FL0890]|nr:hypothetical protein F5Y06DRAFT_137588 [Hypoxylon sp. FL0890]
MDAQNSKAPIEISDDSDSDDEFEGVLGEIRRDLQRCLDKIQTAGLVATSKQHGSFVNPGMMVADTLIPLPLVPRDAEMIRGVCRQAPFGRGDETVVDTSVRKTWELDHSQFKCTNPDWQAYIGSLLNDFSRNLGLSGVKADPYKLLLYDEGSFFKRHKDSEKVPGMVGTLVICLPSRHEGGSVHLSHAGKSYVFDTDKASDFGLTSLAWFSDVTHEIKPLKSGYRLVLTYNIIHTGGIRMSAGLVGKQSANLSKALTRWQSKLPHVEKLVYMLEHKYTQSSLSLSNLKGRDRTVCQSLYEVGLDCGFTIFLARMTRTENEEPEFYDEADETVLNEVKTCDGHTICRRMLVEDEEILGTDLWDRDADSQSEGDFTGNESMPATLRYHDTVVIIVPMQKLHIFLAQADPRALMSFINQTLNDRPDDRFLQTCLMETLEDALKIYPLDGKSLSDILVLAVKLEKKALYRMAVRASLKSMDARHQVLATILRLAKEKLLRDPVGKLDWDFWLNYMIIENSRLSLTALQKTLNYLDFLLQDNDLKDLKPSFDEWKAPIPAKMAESKSSLTMDDHDFLICLLFTRSNDISWLRDWFTPLLSSRGSKQLICAILKAIYDKRNTRMLEIGRAIDTFQCILEGSAEKLALQIGDFPHPDWQTRAHGIKSIEASSVRGVLEVIDEGFDMGLTQQAIELIDASCTNISQSCPKPKTEGFPCSTVIQQFLESLIVILRKYQIFLESVKNMFITLLRNILVANPPIRPKPPRGWAHRPRRCNPACQDCKELTAFLTNSDARTHSFRMPERRRTHIENQLPYNLFRCDTNKGRVPYELVVTKLGKESELDMKDYKQRLLIFENRVRGLRCEEVKSLLGEDLYNELVMLKDIPDSDGAKELGGAGKKRKAEEELEGSSSSRPRIVE